MAKKSSFICVVGICAAVAQAERIDLFVFENAGNADVSGLDLWVDVVDRGSYAEFVFHNDSSVASFVRTIYIEETAFTDGRLTGGRIQNPQPSGVRFIEGSSPPNPAGAIQNFGGGWEGNLFATKAKKPGSGNDGIDAGEQLVLEFDLTGIDFATLLGGLQGDEPQFRIAQHVQGLADGLSVWTKNEPPASVIPLPSAAAMSLAGLMVVGARRRR